MSPGQATALQAVEIEAHLRQFIHEQYGRLEAIGRGWEPRPCPADWGAHVRRARSDAPTTSASLRHPATIPDVAPRRRWLRW